MTDSHPPSHVAVAIRLYAIASSPKMIGTFFDGIDELSPCRVWGRSYDACLAVGSKIWCLYHVLCFCLSRSMSRALCVRGVHSSNKHCVAIYRPISTRFSSFFSEGIALSDTLHSFSLLGGTTIFAKLRSKIAKSPKICRQVCAHHFV